jgi:hypothetical protein
MKPLSRSAFAELGVLQALVRESALDREAALRVLHASRNVALFPAQQEPWLEFTRLDQEYRLAIRKLAAFCAGHAIHVASEERRRA